MKKHPNRHYKTGFFALLIPIGAVLIWNGIFATLEKIAIHQNYGVHPQIVREMIRCNEGDNMKKDPACTGANVKPQ